MKTSTKKDGAFLATRRGLDTERHIIVRYRIQTPGAFLPAAIALSKEQSFSSFEDPTREKELIARYAAKVLVDTEGAGTSAKEPALPSLIHTGYRGRYITREIELAFPEALFGGSLTALMSMAVGEVHNIARFSGMQVVDIQLPKKWQRTYKGPAFGIEGIRRIIGKKRGPILISPVKPCVGLSPDEFAARVYRCLMGGFDGVKDDELLLDPPYCSFKERVRKTMQALREVERQTGQKRIYFANVGGDREQIDEFVDYALRQGVGGIMFSPLLNGFDIVRDYRGKVPIIAHNNLTYAMARHPLSGISFALWATLQRACGADMLICPAPDRSFYVMDMKTHRDNVNACIEKNGLRRSLAGLSGSQTPGTLYRHARFLGHQEFAICPGGAVYEHPLDIEAGARSFVEAIEALQRNVPLARYAKEHEALRESLKRFKKLAQFDR